MTSGQNMSRRGFLKRGSAAAAATGLLPTIVTGGLAAAEPSNRLNVGIIGMGNRGNHHRRVMQQMPEIQIQAVCDANGQEAEKAKKQVEQAYGQKSGGGSYSGCAAYRDFRKVLDRSDIDAVFVTAPENWHALIAASAARAGKDIYCEKALTLTVEEGRRLIEIIRGHGAVLQVGTQQRSASQFRHACELVRNGYLGKHKDVRIGVPGGRSLPVSPAQEPPSYLDYEMWLGPAPWTPYDGQKCSYNWYFMSDYCAGWIQSWGVHHLDILLWGMPEFGRNRVTVEGTAAFPENGPADTSVHWDLEFTSSEGRVAHFGDNGTEGYSQGVRFIGEDGWVHVTRRGLQSEPGSLQDVKIKPGEEHLYESYNHGGNFFECVESRQDPVAPVEAGHRATTLSLIGDIATRLGRRLVFDWEAERFVNDAAANRMLGRTYRGSWVL